MSLHRIAALAATLLLAACGGTDRPPQDPGARVYAVHCVACHQRNGRGLGETQPSLVGTPTVAGDPEALIRWTAFGERPPGLVRGRTLVLMPQFHWLSDDDLAAVLTYVRSEFGNDYPAITAAQVAAVRAARAAP